MRLKQGLEPCQNIYKLREEDKVTFFSAADKVGTPGCVNTRAGVQKVCGWFRSECAYGQQERFWFCFVGDHENIKKKPTMVMNEKYIEIFCINCLIGYRNSERLWLMKSTSTALERPRGRGVKTLPSHLMNLLWSREQKCNRVRVSTVYTRTFRRTQIVISVWRRKITRSSLQKTCWYSRAQSGTFWWFANSGLLGNFGFTWITFNPLCCLILYHLGNV